MAGIVVAGFVVAGFVVMGFLAMDAVDAVDDVELRPVGASVVMRGPIR
ncbi:hypothetical protein GCM10025883_08720 [Mobilicoccus caccae]|uniref:Uncharacterized protein n=1 Tax=Mobilicoccus caccae TaxID=1859295 RepID=A0ABQ6IQ28_9MICO|nr:hypothetical protein GCM10025883_08720 [Mobilicoccus caccae]